VAQSVDVSMVSNWKLTHTHSRTHAQRDTSVWNNQQAKRSTNNYCTSGEDDDDEDDDEDDDDDNIIINK
jgi:hypothetical protein